MNIISIKLVRILNLDLHALIEIEFKELSIRIINHRNTILEY